jgi:hypothetical protein
MTTLVIPIFGKKRSGKDTTCMALNEAFDLLDDSMDIQTFRLSDTLKQKASWALGCSLGDIEERKNDPKSGMRQFLQLMGDLYKESKGQSVLLEGLHLEYHDEEGKDTVIIIPGIRFLFELEWLQAECVKLKYGFEPIHVVRDTGLPEDPHPSEAFDFGFPALTLVNNGTIDELEETAEQYAGHLFNRYFKGV